MSLDDHEVALSSRGNDIRSLSVQEDRSECRRLGNMDMRKTAEVTEQM